MFAASGLSLAAQKQSASAASAARGDDAAAQASPQDIKDVDAEPQDEGRLKGLVRRVGSWASPSDDKEGLSVNAGIIIAGSGLSGGLGYRRVHVFNSPIGFEVEGTMSTRLYQDYRAAIGLLGARSSTLEFDTADRKVVSLFNASARKAPGSALYVDMRYRDYPRHTYYGTGIDTFEDNKADYALRGASVEGVWQWQVSPTFGVSARGGWLDLEVGRGHDDTILNLEDRFAPSTLPGVADPPLFITYGVGLVHDTRANPGAPEDGRLVGVSARRFSASNMEELSFTRLTMDVRGYQAVSAARGVIAVRGLISTDLTGDTGSTPFYLLQSLGGGDTLRGFHSYRFPDQALVHGTVEYRWRAHRFVEVVPFLDAGTVASGLSRVSFDAVKMTPGVGIRARNDRRAFARLDWAWSSEGLRIVGGIGPAF